MKREQEEGAKEERERDLELHSGTEETEPERVERGCMDEVKRKEESSVEWGGRLNLPPPIQQHIRCIGAVERKKDGRLAWSGSKEEDLDACEVSSREEGDEQGQQG